MKARDNPLSTDRVLAVRYRPQGWTWPELLARLESMRFRAAIVGPKGTGKTTLLEDLAERFAAAGRRCRLIRLSADEPRIAGDALRGLEDDELVLLDGAEQLSAARWARLRWRTRGAGGLVITTHTPSRLPTLVETATSPQLLRDILRDLLGSAAPPAADADALLARHHGNVRAALRELYDALAAD